MTPAPLLHHLRAVSRVVERRNADGQTVYVVQATRRYAAPRSAVWAALSEPGRLARWLGPISGDLRVGGRFQLEGNAGGEVLACDPPRSLSVSWELGDDRSGVEVRLSDDDGGTRLVLEHSASPSEHWRTYGPGATGVGWELGLFGLARHLAGADLDSAAFEAWLATEPGRAALVESARGWVAAGVAQGSEPAVATARGRRTAAFYTGVPDIEI